MELITSKEMKKSFKTNHVADKPITRYVVDKPITRPRLTRAAFTIAHLVKATWNAHKKPRRRVNTVTQHGNKVDPIMHCQTQTHHHIYKIILTLVTVEVQCSLFSMSSAYLPLSQGQSFLDSSPWERSTLLRQTHDCKAGNIGYRGYTKLFICLSRFNNDISRAILPKIVSSLYLECSFYMIRLASNYWNNLHILIPAC